MDWFKFFTLALILTTSVALGRKQDKDDNDDDAAPICKRCETSCHQMEGQTCTVIGHNKLIKVKDQNECTNKCRQEIRWCVKAIYVEEGQIINEGDEDEEQNAPSKPDMIDEDEDPRSSRVKREDSGSNYCYLFDKFHSASIDSVQCREYESRNFSYNLLACDQDADCLRRMRNCPCGRCGTGCAKYNYRRVPNACMGIHYYGHKSVSSVKECLDFCLDTDGCRSVDLGSYETCLLNYVNRSDADLIPGCDGKNDEKWDYYEIVCDSECPNEKPRPPPDEDPCLNNPGICLNGGVCETTELASPKQKFTHHCICPPQYCGDRCQFLNMDLKENRCLNDGILAWTVTMDYRECLQICQREPECRSISFSPGAETCVLHWINGKMKKPVSSPECPRFRPDVQETEWDFYQLNCNQTYCPRVIQKNAENIAQGCETSPCQNGGQCEDIKDSDGKTTGYACQCPCGYCGRNCEKENYSTIKDACIWGEHINENPSDYYHAKTTLSECLRVCSVRYPTCKSVDYSNNGDCYLNSKSSDDVERIAPNCYNHERHRWSLHDIQCDCSTEGQEEEED